MPRRKKPSGSILEHPYEYFDILYTQRQRDRQKLASILVGREALNYVPSSILEYILTPQRGHTSPVCKTVIVENNYYDSDHAKAFSSFYSKSFRSVLKECTRLHFFSKRISEDNLSNLENQMDFYLGFCVVRPFIYRRTGRTVVKKIRENPNLEFPVCNGIFDVNIGGSKLTVKGTAFMEQDTMVAACASTALWMSTAMLHRRYNLAAFSTCEITERATQFLVQSRPMPSEGLVVEQMIHALRTMGYDPLLIGCIDQEQAKHVVYTYLESEIPPILLCNLVSGDDHSIVAVGHGYSLPVLQPKRVQLEWPGESPISFTRSSEWVPYIYVNDDQRGLFRKLTPLNEDIQTLSNRIRNTYPRIDVSNLPLKDWHCPVIMDLNMPSVGVGGEEIVNIWGIIVPLPVGVPLTGEQAEKKSARLIRSWHDQRQLPLPDDLVLRTYLITSNEYKQRIAQSKMHLFVQGLFRGKPMPRWIWVTEMSSIGSYNSSRRNRWLIKGEIIIDATSSALTPDFLAFHYIYNNEGYIVTMKPEHKDAEHALHQTWHGVDRPYPGWIR